MTFMAAGGTGGIGVCSIGVAVPSQPVSKIKGGAYSSGTLTAPDPGGRRRTHWHVDLSLSQRTLDDGARPMEWSWTTGEAL